MKMNILNLLSFCLFLASPALALDSSSKKSNKKLNVVLDLAKLNGAANLLLVAADSGIETSCKITPEQAMRWINPLHAMIDEQIEVETKAALNNPKLYWSTRKLDTCEQRCECAQWVSVLETAPKAFGQKKLALLRKKAMDQTPEKLKACARKEADWFCKSELKNTLESESKR